MLIYRLRSAIIASISRTGEVEQIRNESEQPQNLGRLVSSHSTSPAYLQRAAIVAVVSFIFFLAMLAAFYVRQQFGYFVLSSGFLVVYVFTLIGWVMQKRNIVSVHEGGLKYRKFRTEWSEVQSVAADVLAVVCS